MRRLASLALAIAAVAWVHALGETGSVPSAGAALAVGFTLLGAWITGDLLRKFNLPRITGYLIFGVLVGPYLGNVITVPMTSQLQAVNGIATTLIALIAGLTISLERLRTTIASIARFTAATLVIVIIGMAALLWFAWPWLGPKLQFPFFDGTALGIFAGLMGMGLLAAALLLRKPPEVETP